MKKYIKPNLYLYLGKTKQTWYHKEGNKSKAIGEYPHMSEEQALAIVEGKIANITLKALIEEFVEYKKVFLAPKTYSKMLIRKNQILLNCPFIHNLIAEIDTKMVITYYKTITSYETLKRFHSIFKHSFEYAILHSYIDSNIFLSIPLLMIRPKPPTKHMSYSINPEFIKKLLSFIDEQNDKLKLAFIILLILGLRTNTLVQLKVSMIDFKKGLLVIPANIMKMRIEHILPLNNELCDMLQNYIDKYHITDYLFPNQINPYRPMNSQSFRVLLRKAGFSKEEITPHGFRAMISTICYDNEIEDKAIEWYLAHYETSSVSRAYNHSQGLSRKRKVLDFWWNYLKKYYP